MTKLFKAVLFVVLAVGAFSFGACQHRTTEVAPAPATYSK